MIEIADIEVAGIIPVVGLLRYEFDLRAIEHAEEKRVADQCDQGRAPVNVGAAIAYPPQNHPGEDRRGYHGRIGGPCPDLYQQFDDAAASDQSQEASRQQQESQGSARRSRRGGIAPEAPPAPGGGCCDENRNMGRFDRRAQRKRRGTQRDIRKDPERAGQFALERGQDANSEQAACTRSRVPSEWRRWQNRDSIATEGG